MPVPAEDRKARLRDLIATVRASTCPCVTSLLSVISRAEGVTYTAMSIHLRRQHGSAEDDDKGFCNV